MPAKGFRTAQALAAGSFAARAVRDRGNLLVAGVGTGSAWAVGLPFGAAVVVGAGMLGVATVVGDRVRGGSHEPAAPPLRAGTPQAILVLTLQGYRADLERLSRPDPAPLLPVRRSRQARPLARRKRWPPGSPSPSTPSMTP